MSRTNQVSPKPSTSQAPTRPPPPNIGAITHHSIELFWDDAIEKENESITLQVPTSGSNSPKRGDSRVRVCLQVEGQNGQWENVYSGFGKRHVVQSLEPWSQYKYRLQFSNDSGSSEFSPPIIASTTKEPLTGDHLHKALVVMDLQQFEHILDSGDLQCVDVLDKYGQTPMMVAAQKGYIDFMELLVDHGADANFQNDSGKTALMLAAYSGRLDSVKELRYFGATYDLKDKGGSTALHWAMDSKIISMINWMIEDGADVEVKDSNGWTPLMRIAALTGDPECTSLLLRKGAQVNHRDSDGKTCLMTAVVNNHFNMVPLLLEAGADVTIKNEFGKGAYEMAVAMERRKISKILEEHMDKHKISRHI